MNDHQQPNEFSETMEQYIQRRTSDDVNMHWNLSERDLEGMRELLKRRDVLEEAITQASLILCESETAEARSAMQIFDRVMDAAARIWDRRTGRTGDVKGQIIMMTALLGLFGCKRAPESRQLSEVRELIERDRKQPKLADTGRRIPAESISCNSSWTLIAGVWIEDRIYYKALGVSMGNPPAGDDVKDRRPGIPDQVFGGCGRCKRSWKWVNGHVTSFSKTGGCFPLCEKCWSELTPWERLPFYQAWLDSGTRDLERYDGGKYVAEHLATWPAVKEAVLQGK